MTSPILYAPEAYVATDPIALVRQYPFAQFITTPQAGITATATPLFFENEQSQDVMVGHISGRNPHAASLQSGQSVLAIFSGPHAYVSSAWYEEKLTVPTWNYVMAHVRGRLEPVDDRAGTLAILERSAEVMERDSAKPWTMQSAPEGKVDSLLPHIRAFRIHVESIEGVTKLSQAHPQGDRLRVMRQLLDRGDGASTEIARLMAHLQPLC